MSRTADTRHDASLAPRLLGPMLIWLAVVLVGGAVTAFATGAMDPAGRIAVGLALPALLSLLLLPALHRTWSQVLLLALWTGFAVVATLIGGLFPAAITFLCIPAIAMLFTRERVVEALVLAVLALIATLLALTLVELGGSPLSTSAVSVFAMLGTAGTLALTVAAMIAGTQGTDRTLAASTSFEGWADGVAGGLFAFDSQDRLLSANAEGMEQFGLSTIDARAGIDLATLAGTGEAGREMTEAAELARRNKRSLETRMALPSLGAGQSANQLDMTYTPLPDGGLMLHAIDRTASAAQLEQLRRLQTVAEREAQEKTLFFAGVSHELRTPLNAIIGFSDMMRSRLFGPLPGKYAEYADLIHDSGQYMLDLIGDVLDLSKVEAGKYTLVPDTFDMADVVRSSVKMIRPAADSADVAIEIDVPEDDPLLITADRKASRQILLNLMSNAVKFSPKGSTITVSADELRDGLTLSVSDEGPGMSETDIARIGEPFAQGDAGRDADVRGSGLGLSLVKTLAELHQGSLEVSSESGEGTVATVTLPSIDSAT
ncbi:MAG: HAMP domain-containing sensor histidine kinase [Litorimonas sp.]